MVAGLIDTCLHMLRKLWICTTKMVKLKRCSQRSDSKGLHAPISGIGVPSKYALSL